MFLAYDGRFRQIEHQPKAWVLPHDEFLRLIRGAKAPSIMRYARRSEIAPLVHRADAWHLLRDAYQT